MSKILDFIKKEINENAERKSRLETKVHRMEIDLEFIDKAISRMIYEKDNTYHVFSIGDNNNTFDYMEIKALKKQRVELAENINNGWNDISEINEKLIELQELIDVESDNSELKQKFYFDKDNSITILEIQEQERQRIARDIHDSIVQNMTALVHKSEFVMKVIDSDAPRAKLELEVINKITRECIDELRGIIYNLHPMSIDDLGLEVTMKRLIAQLSTSTEMNIQLNYLDNGNKINSIIAITIIRIVQELCSNSIKYAQGSEINISIHIENETLLLIHEDDGIGYEEDILSKPIVDIKTGFGLSMLRERVTLLGGRIAIGKNTNNVGIRYTIEIPCQKEEK